MTVVQLCQTQSADKRINNIGWRTIVRTNLSLCTRSVQAVAHVCQPILPTLSK